MNLEMLRFFVMVLFALSAAATASPASVLVNQYLEFVTKYHVDGDNLNTASLKTRLEGVLKTRCGADATCPTTRVYDDLKAVTRSLPDQSSSFLSPVDLLRLNTEAKRFSLGLEIRGDIVYRVVVGSSAATQGVKRGDRVLGVTRDGVNVPLNALSFVDAKPVTLSVERDGKPVPLTLTPAVNLQSALLTPETALLENGVGYLRIPSFRAPDTAQRVHSLVSALQSRNPKGLLMDLRFNTGGYLDQALLTLAAFLEDGAVLGLESRTATTTYSLRAGGVEVAQGEGVKRLALTFATKFKGRVVVLVNNSTSSAAEVFALALERAGTQFAGEITAGRARYAALPIKLTDGSELRLAVTRNQYPNGNALPANLTPDSSVKDDVTALTKGSDPVLEAGVKLLE
jgi:carboxyl-terminal processing protease